MRFSKFDVKYSHAQYYAQVLCELSDKWIRAKLNQSEVQKEIDASWEQIIFGCNWVIDNSEFNERCFYLGISYVFYGKDLLRIKLDQGDRLEQAQRLTKIAEQRDCKLEMAMLLTVQGEINRSVGNYSLAIEGVSKIEDK